MVPSQVIPGRKFLKISQKGFKGFKETKEARFSFQLGKFPKSQIKALIKETPIGGKKLKRPWLKINPRNAKIPELEPTN